ncbi:arylamine N-acetyltransferase family protein [Streptomyces antimicrobicus]|uniref:Arylamine N-acetyltransferase n=1 Tax=Streptomyces antimicrobicus TaxID=2883108 RepID=A0ABS8B020_9ACTN|nr:arylamine N-acetyltransferase [Streptomyces antimicrobicus]MCB5177954.1 arylamine N-acetyltransferase [Streptomyces antimicrobicus]
MTRTHDGDRRFGLQGYLRRIGWQGEFPRADVGTLRALHRAHAMSIPFENVDVALLRSVPSLALPDLEAKVLHARRGGYCYEHNTLLSAALREVGFGVTTLTARVVAGARRPMLPRTHMMMLVDVPGEELPFIADVGFGSHNAPVEAMPLQEGVETAGFGRRLRFTRQPSTGPSDMWALEAYENGAWGVQYAFTLEPFEDVDIAMINWHIATNPRSPAVHTLYASITRPDVHLGLYGTKVVERYADGSRKERELNGPEEIRGVLADIGVDLPQGARL